VDLNRTWVAGLPRWPFHAGNRALKCVAKLVEDGLEYRDQSQDEESGVRDDERCVRIWRHAEDLSSVLQCQMGEEIDTVAKRSL